MNWFRVPEWCALSDDPAEVGAAVWLLGRWHLGRSPSVAECKRAWGWGWDRCNAFAARIYGWAGEAGARRPETSPGKSGSNRGGSPGKAGRPDADANGTSGERRGGIGEASGSNRGASCARDPLLEREETKETEENLAPPAPAVAPTPSPVATKSKPPKASNPESKHPGYSEAIAAFAEEHESIFGTRYPWAFGVRDGDPPRVKSWLAVAKVRADDIPGGVHRIRLAARAYLRAVEAGTAWPRGEPPQTRHFTRDIAKWLQTDPDALPAARASPQDDRQVALDMLRNARLRLVES